MHLVASRNHKHPDTWDVINADCIPECWGQAERAAGWPYAAYVECDFKSQQEAEEWIANYYRIEAERSESQDRRLYRRQHFGYGRDD